MALIDMAKKTKPKKLPRDEGLAATMRGRKGGFMAHKLDKRRKTRGARDRHALRDQEVDGE